MYLMSESDNVTIEVMSETDNVTTPNKMKSPKNEISTKMKSKKISQLKMFTTQKYQGQIMSVSDNVRVRYCQDLVNVRAR